MIRRLLVLPALAAALVVGDISARGFVNTQATERAQQGAPPGAVVRTSVGGFPFLPPLLLSGAISQVGIHLENVAAGNGISFATVDLRLRGVDLDRTRLLQERKVRILGIDRGTVEVVITQDALSAALKIPVRIANGAVSVTLLQRSFAVTPSISAGGRLSLAGAAGQTLTLTLPELDYVPCFGEVTVLAGRLRFSCEINDMPAELLDALESST